MLNFNGIVNQFVDSILAAVQALLNGIFATLASFFGSLNVIVG